MGLSGNYLKYMDLLELIQCLLKLLLRQLVLLLFVQLSSKCFTLLDFLNASQELLVLETQ